MGEGTVAAVAKDLIDASYGWGRYVCRLETRDVPGDHITVLERPNAERLADTLRPRLALAETAAPVMAVGAGETGPAPQLSGR
jgi:hypothetical protein